MNDFQDKPYFYIETDSALKSLIAQMRQANQIAIDIEADSMHHYYEKVCIIQLTFNCQNYIVDPLLGMDVSEFLEVLSSKFLIVHDGGYDLRMMRSSFDFSPGPEIFDTMLAAQLLGFQHFGLGALVERFFGIKLKKGSQKADWSRRPLSPALLKYASDDTRYLFGLTDKLSKELNRLGRYSWHQQACERMVGSTALDPPPPDPENIWRIKGASLLKPSELVFVKEIYYWRQEQAQKADRPPFKIMPNRQILELAVWAKTHGTTPLGNGPKIPRNCKAVRLKALERAILKAHKTPESDWPSRRKKSAPRRYIPDCKLFIHALWDESHHLANQLHIPPSILATRAAIGAIAFNRPQTVSGIMKCSRMMLWQAELLQPVVQKIMKKLEIQPTTAYKGQHHGNSVSGM